MSFFLLILVTAILFIRPNDFIPVLESIQLYLIAILACLATSVNVVTEQLSGDSLRRRPITACVFGLFWVTLLSNLCNFRFDGLVNHGIDFVKQTLFYLLVVGLVNSRNRLRCYLLSVAGILIVPIGMALLQHYRYIDLPAFRFVVVDRSTGGIKVINDGRMRGSGMFNDPNDVCLLINVGLMLSLYGLLSTRGMLRKILWLAPVVLFVDALRATQSRGGLLGALASIAVLLVSRFGIRKGLLLASMAVPLVLSQMGGRQVEFDSSEGTAQGRIQLWRSALAVFRTSPILGVGTNRTEEFIGKAVHGSFVQTYSDLGFLGGTLWVGAFYHSYRRLFQLQARGRSVPDPDLDFMRPFIMAAVTGYVIVMMSTNHPYHVTTYWVLALAAAAICLADKDQPPPGEVLSGRLIWRLIGASLIFLIAMNVYIRIFGH